MEANKDGELVRQHHRSAPIKISCVEGSKNRIQRISEAEAYDGQKIRCPSTFVSRRHCEIFRKDRAYWIKDLGSANGTFLNGIKLIPNHDRELRFGDFIGIGVSHLDQEEHVNVKDSLYYVYLFKQEEHLVIDLDEEEDEAPVKKAQEEVPAKTCLNVNSNSDDDIEIIEDTVSGSSSTKSTKDSNSNNSSNSSPEKKARKAMPPPPPPPIYSKSMSDLLKMSPSTGNTKRDSKPSISSPSALPTSAKKFDNQVPSTSKSANAKVSESGTSSATDIKNKRHLQFDHQQQQPVKRAKQDSSSSDDSSDGLGDCEEKALTNGSRKKSSIYSGKSSEESSCDEKEVDLLVDDKPAWNILSRDPELLVPKNRKSSEGIDSRSHKRPTRVLNISDSDSNNEDDEEVEKRRKYEILKSEAKGKVGTSCTIKLERLIKYNTTTGKFELTKTTYNALEPVSRRRMQAQFRESLKRNKAFAQPAEPFPSKLENSRDLLKTERNPLPSPAAEENEEVMHESSPDINESNQPNDNFEDMDTNIHVQGHDDDNSSSEMDVDDDDLPNVYNLVDDRTKEKFSTAFTTPIKPPEPVTPKSNSARKGIQLLVDAPLPRHVVKAQIKNAAFKPPAAVTTPKSHKVSNRVNESPGVSYSMTREEQKRARSEKLKDLERKNQQEKMESTPDRSPKKPPQPAKIKVTSRNRNEGLMDSIIQSTSKSTEDLAEKKDETSTVNPVVTKKAVPQFTLSDPRLSRDTGSRVMPRDPRLHMPNVVANRTKTNQKQSAGAQSSSNVPGPSSSGRSGPKAENVSNNLKPGAHPILSPPPALGNVAYREKDKPVKPFQLNHQPRVSEEDIFKRIAIWKPDWIEEQKHFKGQEPPLLKETDNLTLTLKRYESYDAYFKIYYPLLLHEIWASISSDYFNIKSRGHDTNDRNNSRSDNRMDYKAKIEDVKRTPHCSLVKSKKGAEKPHGEDYWVNVKYHTWVQRFGDIDYRKDLTILSMQGTDKTTGKKVLKKVFGFPCDASKKCEPISRTLDCDVRLKKKDGNDPGCRFSETLVCRFGSNFDVDTTQLAHVARIHNISPKLREFRALNNLRSFRLCQDIVSPVDRPGHSWQAWLNKHAATPGPTHDMITLCRKLNMEQKSVVSYISQRISSNDPALMLLHGPPGTGKTTTIVALVLQLLVQYQRRIPSKTHRILICTPSNAAIDEIMRRLVREIRNLPSSSGGNISLVRVGEGYAKELEKYSLNAKVKEIDEDKSTTTSINVEITSVREDISEVSEKIRKLKTEDSFCRIKLQSLLSQLEDHKKRDQALTHDLKATKIKKNVSTEDNQNKGAMIIKKSNIICSTLSSSGTSLMKAAIRQMQMHGERAFLCCIVDEASQTTEPETLLPLTLNIEKMLLVGDPHQLGATVLSNVAEDKQYGQSLFSRHYNFYKRLSSSPIMMLRRQYRMHEQIVKWPNAYFYDNQLQNQYNAPPPNYPLRPYYFLNLTGREHSEAEGRIENTDEVQMVKTLVETIDEMLLPVKSTWTIGVITPYSAQKHSIINAFHGSSFRNFKNVEIDTVDGFQGQERDIVILSCVRTDATGFLKSRNRLNVALTRARHSLFIIGDARCLSKMDMWNCLIKDAANDNNKFDVDPDFRLNLKMLKTLLHTNLKKKVD